MPRSKVKYEIAREDIENSEDYQTSSKKQLLIWQRFFLLVSIIFPYFVLSVGLTFYQKWLFKTYGFGFPLAAVVCHSLLKYLICALINYGRTYFKAHQPIRLSCKSVMWALATPGVATGVDVGLSNKSLKFISVPLYTMTKSTSIIFIVGFALLFKLERKSVSMVFIVLMISGGLIMFTYKSTDFHLLGFLLCLLASLSSGIRWTLAQIVMQRSKLGIRNPVDMMYYMQPWILVSIIPMTILFEGQKMYKEFLELDWTNSSQIYMTTGYVGGGGLIAFCMEIFEFLVVTYTSSLTLSIIGILKEISIFFVAFEFGGDTITTFNFIGLPLCLGGITLHVMQKLLWNKRESSENVELETNSLSVDSKFEDGIETDRPLLMEKSTSLTNLLNSNFSSDEEEEIKDPNSPKFLFKVLQHRDQ
ncbi:solute carrier family 35 member C2-like isoform X1 [Belonocnema kinseyi]|uniref:solute carrier family 35 member C2-like isoform X1 n=1 Tax=Belonocnema kinseyi TaxID=2817044 RepID=UPI00143D5B56|nr:solute carrier family 35 member C2-like isoform X1 [Belonocnema kinseyi]